MVTVPQSEIQSLRDKVRSLAAEPRDMRKSIPSNNNTAGNSFNSGSGYNTKQQITMHLNAGNALSMVILQGTVELRLIVRTRI